MRATSEFQLLLTYSTSSRQALTRRSRSRFFASGASHCDPATDFSQAERLPLQLAQLMHRKPLTMRERNSESYLKSELRTSKVLTHVLPLT